MNANSLTARQNVLKRRSIARNAALVSSASRSDSSNAAGTRTGGEATGGKGGGGNKNKELSPLRKENKLPTAPGGGGNRNRDSWGSSSKNNATKKKQHHKHSHQQQQQQQHQTLLQRRCLEPLSPITFSFINSPAGSVGKTYIKQRPSSSANNNNEALPTVATRTSSASSKALQSKVAVRGDFGSSSNGGGIPLSRQMGGGEGGGHKASGRAQDHAPASSGSSVTSRGRSPSHRAASLAPAASVGNREEGGVTGTGSGVGGGGGATMAAKLASFKRLHRPASRAASPSPARTTAVSETTSTASTTVSRDDVVNAILASLAAVEVEKKSAATQTMPVNNNTKPQKLLQSQVQQQQQQVPSAVTTNATTMTTRKQTPLKMHRHIMMRNSPAANSVSASPQPKQIDLSGGGSSSSSIRSPPDCGSSSRQHASSPGIRHRAMMEAAARRTPPKNKKQHASTNTPPRKHQHHFTTPPKHPMSSSPMKKHPMSSSPSRRSQNREKELATMMVSSLTLSPAMQKLVSKYGATRAASAGRVGGANRGGDEDTADEPLNEMTPLSLARQRRCLLGRSPSTTTANQQQQKQHQQSADRQWPTNAAAQQPARSRWAEVIEMKRSRSLSAAAAASMSSSSTRGVGSSDRTVTRSDSEGSQKKTWSKIIEAKSGALRGDSLASSSSSVGAFRGLQAAEHLARRRHRSLSAQRSIVEDRIMMRAASSSTPETKPKAAAAAALPSFSSSSYAAASASSSPALPPSSRAARGRAAMEMHRRRGQSLSAMQPSKQGETRNPSGNKLLQRETEILSNINLDKCSSSRYDRPLSSGKHSSGLATTASAEDRSPPRAASSTRNNAAASAARQALLSRRVNAVRSRSLSVPRASSPPSLQPASSIESESSSPDRYWGNMVNLGVTQSCSFTNPNVVGVSSGDDEEEELQRYAQVQMKRKRAREMLARRSLGR